MNTNGYNKHKHFSNIFVDGEIHNRQRGRIEISLDISIIFKVNSLDGAERAGTLLTADTIRKRFYKIFANWMFPIKNC